MTPPLKPIDPRTADRKEEVRVEIVMGPSAGLFTKVLGGAAALLLLALAFVFSLLVFSLLAAVGLVLLARVWWARRHTHHG